MASDSEADPSSGSDSAGGDLPGAEGESIWSDDPAEGIGTTDGIGTTNTEPSWTDRVPGWMVWFRRAFFLGAIVSVGLMLADDTGSAAEGAPFGSTGAAGIGLMMGMLAVTGLVTLVWPQYVYFAGFRVGYNLGATTKEPSMRQLLLTRFVVGPMFLFAALVCGFMLSGIARDVPA